MVSDSWILDCLKMFKISNKIINFITEAMKKIESGIYSWRKNFTRDENPEWHLPWKCAFAITNCNNNDVTQLHAKEVHKLTKSQEKINHLKCMDNIILFAKRKKIGDSDINNKNIQTGYTNGIWH